MRTLIAFLVCTTVLVSAYTPGPSDAATLLNKVYKKYSKQTSMSYTMLYRQKFLDNKDTFNWNATCKLIPNAKDTVFGGIIWFSTDSVYDRYYDHSSLYFTDHKQKKIVQYNPYKNQTGIIHGNTAGQVIEVFFLNPKELIDYTKEYSYTLRADYTDTYALVTIIFPDEDGFTHQEKKIWIRSKDYAIYKITYRVKFMGNWQYNEWNLTDIVFNKVKPQQLKKDFQRFEKQYTREIFYEPTAEELAPLAKGLQAPGFSGTAFQDQTEFTLARQKGKYVVLDFSYMSCWPCMKVIPHLNTLSETYAGKNVLIAGLNSIDNNENGKKQLPDFISKHQVNYPLILTSRKTDSLYNVHMYPTLYVINPEGKIVFTQVGFSENTVDSIQKYLPR